MITLNIIKKDMSFRRDISVSWRLATMQRFLTTGNSYTLLGYFLKISKQAISYIVPAVCNALVVVLQDYVKVRKV